MSSQRLKQEYAEFTALDLVGIMKLARGARFDIISKLLSSDGKTRILDNGPEVGFWEVEALQTVSTDAWRMTECSEIEVAAIPGLDLFRIRRRPAKVLPKISFTVSSANA